MWYVLLKCFSIFPVPTCGKQPKFHKYSPLILYVLGYGNKHNSSLPGFNPGIISVQFSQNHAKTTSAFAFIPNDKYNVKKKSTSHFSPTPNEEKIASLFYFNQDLCSRFHNGFGGKKKQRQENVSLPNFLLLRKINLNHSRTRHSELPLLKTKLQGTRMVAREWAPLLTLDFCLV